MFGELLLKARRNGDEEVLARVTSKAFSVETEVKDGLEEKIDKLLAVAKSGQMEKARIREIGVGLQNQPLPTWDKTPPQKEIESET